MKRRGIFFARLFFLSLTFTVISQAASQYDRAMSFLNDRNEVVFKTSYKDMEELKSLATSFVIDKINGPTVYIYADKESFPRFLNLKKEYEVFEYVAEPEDQVPGSPQEIVSYPSDNSPYSGYEGMLEELESTYPEIIEVSILGATTTDLNLYGVKMSDNITIDQSKPRFLGTGTMHGDEQGGMHCLLRLIEWLASNYGSDQTATDIIDNTELYFIPLVNAEGAYPNGSFNRSYSVRRSPNCTDVNRSFPTPPPADQGPQYPNGDNERDVIMELAEEKIFPISTDLHSGMVALVCPWSSTKTSSKVHPDYNGYFKTYGEKISSLCGGVTVGWAAVEWYLGYGTIFDYMVSHASSRNFCLELTSQKKPNASTAEGSWDDFKDALIYMIQQVQYGIHGITLNAGEPVPAKIFVDNHDKYDSHVYSNEDFGYFVRPIHPGTFDLTITYESYTIEKKGVVVTEDNRTDLGVIEMSGTPVTENANKAAKKALKIFSHDNAIHLNNGTSEKTIFTVYTVNGARVGSFSVNPNETYKVDKERVSTMSGSGIYIVNTVNSTTSFAQRIVIR